MTTATIPITRAKPKQKHKILNRGQLLVYKLLFAHLGKFIIAAFYFVLLQILHGQHTTIFSHVIVLPNVKGTWDSLLSASTSQGGLIHLMSPSRWDSLRHVVFRGLLEGVLGMVLFRQIGFNIEKYRAKLDKDPGKLDRLILRTKVFASPYQDRPVTPVQYLFLPIMLLLVTICVGVPLYFGVDALAQSWGLHWLNTPGVQHGIIQKLYEGSEVYEGLVIGLVVGVLAARTYRAYLYANTMNYGRAWVAKDRGPKWWMPLPTRNLIRELCEEGVEHQQEKLAERNDAMKILVPLGITFAVALAVTGWLVIQTNGFTS